MSGTNQFLAFATGGGANTLTPAAYAALTTLIAEGFQSGIAPSVQFNTALRQASFVAAAIGQFVANSGLNANDDGNLSELTANILSAIQAQVHGPLINVQVFTSSGTYTPTTGTNSVYVKGQGAGAAGGGSAACSSSQNALGGGGSSGTYAEGRFTSGFSGVAVTIGAAGAGVSGATGGNGGTTSFGSLMSCPGGLGGVSGATATPPANGATGGASPGAATGTLLLSVPGEAGGISACTALSVGSSGAGASSQNGAGGVPKGAVTSGAGNPGTGYGAGGAGSTTAASGAAQTGGAGSPGIVIVYEYA